MKNLKKLMKKLTKQLIAIGTIAPIAPIAFGVAISASGCRQGLGERCQVNADCAPNICSQSEPKVCIKHDDETNDIDATLPDAP